MSYLSSIFVSYYLFPPNTQFSASMSFVKFKYIHAGVHTLLKGSNFFNQNEV